MMTDRRTLTLVAWVRDIPVLGYWRGVAVALLIAAASTFLSEHYGAPTMLFALLIGLSLGFLGGMPPLQAGLNFTAKTVLRLGVGLLGIQLGFEDVKALGVSSIAAVLAMVMLTILTGVALSFATGRRLAYGILSGGAVAVCGASAALAFAAVLPSRPDRERDTVLVVIVVTILSTVAMVLYPILFQRLGFSDIQTGFLLGATIHDVAQVVGAGYSVSDAAGLTATLTKMLRVASLPLLVLAVHLIFRDGQGGRTFLPWFLVLFIALAVLRSTGLIPPPAITFLSQAAGWMIVTAIAAIGLLSNLKAVVQVHPTMLAILGIETLFLLILALIFTMKIL